MHSNSRLALPTLLRGYQLTALLVIAHLVMDTLTSMPLGLLPLLQTRFGLTETTVALLVGILSFSTSVTQPLFGALADRFGRRLVAASGLILNAVLLSLVGVVSDTTHLIVLFLIGGLGSGALHPAGASIVRTGITHNKGLAVSLFSTGGTLGYALGPVIILYVVSNLGLGFMPWFMIPGILLGLAVYVLTPEDEHGSAEQKPKFLDMQMLIGPVGLLTFSGIFAGLAFVTFTSAVPLWLVAYHNVAPDDPLIGWTLAAFTLAAALGGMVAAALSSRIEQRLLVSGSLLLSPLPLLLMFTLEPNTLSFFLTVMAGGALIHASLPLMIVSAQNLAPQATATAAGMLMGFSTGIAGILYIGVGYLQETLGLVPAVQISYLAAIPAALLAFHALRKSQLGDKFPKQQTPDIACSCSICACTPCVITMVPGSDT
jgi:MFS transporter, FSR family, fosmidomycin resistance protein